MIGAGAIIGWRHVGGLAFCGKGEILGSPRGQQPFGGWSCLGGSSGGGDPKATSAPSGSNDHGPWQASSCQLGLGH